MYSDSVGKPIQFSANLYHYTFNNPINLKDPSGLDPYNRGLIDKAKDFYCEGGGKEIVSVCSDAASVVGTITIQPEVAGAAVLVSYGNLVASQAICGPSLTPSTVTTGLNIPLPGMKGKIFGVIMSTIDAGLTLGGQ